MGRAGRGRAAPTAINIGAIVSQTGPDSNLGGQARAGYEMAVADINARGGVMVKELGKKLPLALIVRDMESSPEKAVARMETLYAVDKVLAYVGTTFIAAGSGVAEKNGVPTVVIASAQQAVHERGYKYWFAGAGKNPDVARVIFQVLGTIPADKKPQRAAVFVEQSDFGLEIANFFKEAAEKNDLAVVAEEKYSMLNRDMSPLIEAARQARAEVVLAAPIMPDAMTMVRQMKQLDYSPKALIMIRAADDLSWGKAMRGDGDYVALSGGWHHALGYPGVAGLNKEYQAKFGRPADTQAGPAYGAIQIIADAIERAGSLDRAKIREAILATDMMTVAGPIKYRPNGALIDPCDAAVQWQKGVQELVWPPKFKTKDFIYPMPAWADR